MAVKRNILKERRLSPIECEEADARGGRTLYRGRLTPDDPFLIQQVVDDFDAVAHLNLSLFGHGDDGSHQFSGFNFIQRRKIRAWALFEIAAKTCQGKPPG